MAQTYLKSGNGAAAPLSRSTRSGGRLPRSRQLRSAHPSRRVVLDQPPSVEPAQVRRLRRVPGPPGFGVATDKTRGVSRYHRIPRGRLPRRVHRRVDPGLAHPGDVQAAATLAATCPASPPTRRAPRRARGTAISASNAIPPELRDRRQWVPGGSRSATGKPTKVPYRLNGSRGPRQPTRRAGRRSRTALAPASERTASATCSPPTTRSAGSTSTTA